MKNLRFYGVVLIILALGIMWIWRLHETKPPVKPASAVGSVVTNPKVLMIDGTDQPYAGKEEAKVSVVEFGNYNCEPCRNLDNGLFPIIEKEYIQKGKVKWYFISDAFLNKESDFAAKIGEAVYQVMGNEGFWQYHQRFTRIQSSNPNLKNETLYSEAYLMKLIGKFATKEQVSKIQKQFKEDTITQRWNHDLDLARQYGVTNTPMLFINGKQFIGHTPEELKEAIRQAEKVQKEI
jgi:protein-disulfide isomerase